MRALTICLLLVASAASALAQEAPDSTANIPEPFLKEYGRAVLENWVYFGGGFKQSYWFLPNTVRRTARGTSTVWSVSIQAPDSTGDWSSAREAIIAARERENVPTARYETYLLTKLQWEVDCAHQKLRIIQVYDYNEEGEVIYSGKSKSELEEQIPDTNGENLVRVFCHPALRRTFDQLLGLPGK